MPAHWLPWPVKRNATFAPAAVASRPSPPSTAPSRSSSSSRFRKQTPARTRKWLRPLAAVHAASASRSAVHAPGSSANRSRYRPASSLSALPPRAASGNTRTARSRNSPSPPGGGSVTGTAAPSASPSGPYASSTRWAFVPDTEKELTAARRGRPAVSGHTASSAVTRTGSASHAIRGFGVWKWRCFGMTPRRMASRTLITPATPAAASRCPTFVFTDPISRGSPGSRPSPYTAPAASTSIGSPSSVPVPWASR